VNQQNEDTNTLVNSGILVAYSIQHVLEAIDANAWAISADHSKASFEGGLWPVELLIILRPRHSIRRAMDPTAFLVRALALLSSPLLYRNLLLLSSQCVRRSVIPAKLASPDDLTVQIRLTSSSTTMLFQTELSSDVSGGGCDPRGLFLHLLLCPGFNLSIQPSDPPFTTPPDSPTRISNLQPSSLVTCEVYAQSSLQERLKCLATNYFTRPGSKVDDATCSIFLAADSFGAVDLLGRLGQTVSSHLPFV
jgi:hypothetical protein